jgi:hypothetical protein
VRWHPKHQTRGRCAWHVQGWTCGGGCRAGANCCGSAATRGSGRVTERHRGSHCVGEPGTWWRHSESRVFCERHRHEFLHLRLVRNLSEVKWSVHSGRDWIVPPASGLCGPYVGKPDGGAWRGYRGCQHPLVESLPPAVVWQPRSPVTNSSFAPRGQTSEYLGKGRLVPWRIG